MQADEKNRNEAVDLAINRVLQAEQDAQAAVDRCREQAKETLEQVRRSARRIRKRSEQRILLVQQRAERGVALALERVAKQEAAAEADGEGALGQQQMLERAIGVLINEMFLPPA